MYIKSPYLLCETSEMTIGGYRVKVTVAFAFTGILRRCVSCRSRGELGSCKDPFTMNSTQIAFEKGVDVVPCVSGWCGKIIESQNLNNGKLFSTNSYLVIFFSSLSPCERKRELSNEYELLNK